MRYDGYCVSDPVYYEDETSNWSFKGYSHGAYLFLENGFYLRSVKQSEKSLVSFDKSDFKEDYPNKYKCTKEDLILTFHTNEEWEFDEYFKKISSLEFINKTRKFNFIKWEKHESQ